MAHRRLLGIALSGLALLLVTLGVGSPARAAGEIRLAGDYACNIYPGDRGGSFIATSNVDTVGTVKAISITPASAAKYITAVGSEFGGNKTAWVDWAVGPGPTSVSMSVTIRWESGGPDGGAFEATAGKTLSLNLCMPRPWAALKSKCDGSVEITLGNGEANDVRVTGGHAKFEIFGAFGYHQTNIYVQPWYGPSTHTVPADAASSIKVLGEGKVVAEGGYVAAPGCVGYVPGQAAPRTGTGSTRQTAAPPAPDQSALPSEPPPADPSASAVAQADDYILRSLGRKGSSSASLTYAVLGGAIAGGLALGGLVAFLLRRRRSAGAQP